MAVQNPYLSSDGDLGEATRRRAGGGSLSIASDLPLPGNPARAARLAAQAAQPVIGPRGQMLGAINAGITGRATGGDTAGGAPAQPQRPGILDGVAGGAKAVSGAVALPFAVGIDSVRAGVARAVGGDPDTLPGGRSRYADAASAMLDQGLTQASTAADELQAGVRQRLGVQPSNAPGTDANPLAILPTAEAAAVATPGAPQAPAPAATPAPAAAGQEFVRSGIGAGLPGGEIAMRRNADGVYEFTNDQEAVRGAGAMPRGGAGRMGDGRGTFSQAEAGSAQLALDRFERANQERGRMVTEAHRGELGNNGGRVTVVRDSSRTPTLQERQLARHEARLAQTEALRAQTEQGILSGLDSRMTSAVQRQRIGQEMEIDQVGLNERKRLEALQAQLADPSLSPEQREAARALYTAISTPAKDRFRAQDVILGRDDTGRDVRGTQLIDVTTGRPVTGIGDALPSQSAMPAPGTRKGGYEFLGGDPADQNNWRKV